MVQTVTLLAQKRRRLYHNKATRDRSSAVSECFSPGLLTASYCRPGEERFSVNIKTIFVETETTSKPAGRGRGSVENVGLVSSVLMRKDWNNAWSLLSFQL